MKRILSTLLLSASAVIIWTGPGFSISPIPQETGISGFINVGGGGISGKSNMIAGIDFVEIGKKRIDSIFDSPDSESNVIPVLNGELAYTFGSSRTQVYIGNSFEDFIRFETVSLVGLRQELPDKSILEVSYVFSALATEVWADPYVEGQDRSKTDRSISGLRLGYDKILGSDFEGKFTWRRVNLDDELSGLTQQGLTPDRANLLDREGDIYQFEVLYPFLLKKGKHILAPALSYTLMNLDGEAMANDRYQGQLTYFYTGKIFNVSANLLYAYADYKETNPIYLKSREDNIYGGSLSVFYKNLLDVERMSLVGTVANFKSDANIDFYDTTINFFSLSVLYRF